MQHSSKDESMEFTGIKYCNSYYTKTPAAVLKIAQLVFGAGAWGPVIIPTPPYTSGQFSFFLWCVFGSWILVLLTYLLGLCKLSVPPKTAADWKRYQAPELDDLFMNAAIVLIYIPAIVVFGVYSFPLNAVSPTSPIFILIMAILTFLLHAFYASSLFLYFTLGDKWEMEKRWIWQTADSIWTPPESGIPHKHQRPAVKEGYDNPETIPETTQPARSEIYQDVR